MHLLSSHSVSPSELSLGDFPQRVIAMSDWKVYRTRFLVRARQLDQPLVIEDACGRLHTGNPGDYLVECSDGTHRLSPRHVFEDVYVEMSAGEDLRPAIRILEAPVQLGNPAD